MITQLFKTNFLASEGRQINLNILREPVKGGSPPNWLMVIKQSHSNVLDKKTNDA